MPPCRIVLGECCVFTTKACVYLAMFFWSAFTPSAIADVIHDNYLPANGYGLGAWVIRERTLLLEACHGPPGCQHEYAMAFTVPPGIDYKLDRIELTMRMATAPYCVVPTFLQLWSDSLGVGVPGGVPGAFYAGLGQLSPAMAPSNTPVFYTATPGSATTILHQNTKYWAGGFFSL